MLTKQQIEFLNVGVPGITGVSNVFKSVLLFGGFSGPASVICFYHYNKEGFTGLCKLGNESVDNVKSVFSSHYIELDNLSDELIKEAIEIFSHTFIDTFFPDDNLIKYLVESSIVTIADWIEYRVEKPYVYDKYHLEFSDSFNRFNNKLELFGYDIEGNKWRDVG